MHEGLRQVAPQERRNCADQRPARWSRELSEYRVILQLSRFPNISTKNANR